MDCDWSIQYWRTHEGHEVDFILGDAKIAIEVKFREQIDRRDLKDLNAFQEEHPNTKAYVICQAPRPRLITLENHGITHEIEILPYREFLALLWTHALPL